MSQCEVCGSNDCKNNGCPKCVLAMCRGPTQTTWLRQLYNRSESFKRVREAYRTLHNNLVSDLIE